MKAKDLKFKINFIPDDKEVTIYDRATGQIHSIVNIFIGDECCIEFGKFSK